jgi:hypothetical protein
LPDQRLADPTGGLLTHRRLSWTPPNQVQPRMASATLSRTLKTRGPTMRSVRAPEAAGRRCTGEKVSSDTASGPRGATAKVCFAVSCARLFCRSSRVNPTAPDAKRRASRPLFRPDGGPGLVVWTRAITASRSCRNNAPINRDGCSCGARARPSRRAGIGTRGVSKAHR